jgi:tRNA (guanine-N7-)-methyltransferase
LPHPSTVQPGRWYERETPRYAIPDDFADAPLFVEFGCGKGDFINALAVSPEAARTGALMIGVEGGGSIVLAALRKTTAAGLFNVRYINHYVNDAAAAFAPASLDGVLLNFSDPWPKDRHADRRLTSPSKAVAYLSVLKPGGFAVLKTDGKALYEYSIGTFRAAGFTIIYQTDDLSVSVIPGESSVITGADPGSIHPMALVGVATQTEYERRFRSLGYPISCFIAIRSA